MEKGILRSKEFENYYKILQNRETILDYKRLHYVQITEAKIICNCILKELEDIKEMHEVEVITNKVLEIIINMLVEDQIRESEEY